MPARALSVSRQISERNERKPLGFAFRERRVREQGRRHRLQRERHAQFLHHVGFGGEIEIGLHRAGPVHHVETERADLGHVSRHDLVAALRHFRHLGARPAWRHADAEKADTERARDLAHLGEMRHQLARSLVHGLDLRTGQLELAARFERDRAAAGHVEQADDVRAFHDRLPAEQVLHSLEQRANTAASLVGHRPMTFEREREFLVFGADAERRFRLYALRDPIDEVGAPLDRSQVDLVTRHGAPAAGVGT